MSFFAIVFFISNIKGRVKVLVSVNNTSKSLSTTALLTYTNIFVGRIIVFFLCLHCNLREIHDNDVLRRLQRIELICMRRNKFTESNGDKYVEIDKITG